MAGVIRRTKWQIWKDVIFALFVREIRTGFNDKLGLSWAIINPVAFIFILSFARGRLDGGETHGMPTFVFMAHGMLMIQVFLTIFSSISKTVKKSAPLYAFRQVQPISPVIAATLFGMLVKVFVIFGVIILMYLLSIELVMSDFLLYLSNFLMLVIVSSMVGFIFGITAMFVPEVSKVQQVFTRPMFFISGVFFSLKDIPREYWWLLDWNPVLHVIELNRFAAYPSYGSLGVDQGFLALTSLFLTVFTLVYYRATWKSGVSR